MCMMPRIFYIWCKIGKMSHYLYYDVSSVQGSFAWGVFKWTLFISFNELWPIRVHLWAWEHGQSMANSSQPMIHIEYSFQNWWMLSGIFFSHMYFLPQKNYRIQNRRDHQHLCNVICAARDFVFSYTHAKSSCSCSITVYYRYHM